jgi:thioesterase domain-containing protein
VAHVVAMAGLPPDEPVDPRFSPHLVIPAELGAAEAAGHLAALATDVGQLAKAKLMAVPTAEDVGWAQQRRAHARAIGGLLDPVLPLRDGGTGAPLFCAPPLIGVSWCYLALLPHIAPDHGVYALQSRGLRQPEPLPVDMAELASDFADHIRDTQPHGPYHLFGWSLGGNLAYAIAEELERRGQEVGLLAIGDATPQTPGRIQVPEGFAWLLCDFLLREFGYQPAIEPDEPHPEARMLELIRSQPGLGLAEWTDQQVLALPQVITNTIAVAQNHRPSRVHGPTLFFAATQDEHTTEQKLASWRDHLGTPPDVIELDCPHEHMLLPEPATRIGAEITPRLSTVYREAAAPTPQRTPPPTTHQMPPRHTIEATMARIWADLLRRTSPIGIHDNLFHLGGNSLTAVRFAARIADTYGVNLPLDRIVATPTIAKLAELLTASS